MTGIHTIGIADDFGSVAADGAAALAFRHRNIDPYLALCERVVIDFTGVRSANSSFVNALVAGLLEENGEAVLSKIAFKGCNRTLQVLIESAIHLGLCKRQERQCA
ncbi:MAG: STAS-like domain-containing protein [Terrimicrobiaceae bacterium]|nr:STAS-like domain-containing protein [Terrimicrobiaceae bacterium]